MIRENGNWNNWSMIEIEKYPCNDDNEARSRERYWYEVLNANMNSQCPTLDLKKKKETSKICCKNYYEKNKEYIIEQNKDYNEIHKESIIKYQKQYREINKDKIKQNKNEKHQCECGGRYSTCHKSQHNKTKKHLKYIQENESE